MWPRCTVRESSSQESGFSAWLATDDGGTMFQPTAGAEASGWKRTDSIYCPEPEVRTPLRRVRLPTSGSKGALESYACCCPFDSEVRMRVCCKVLRTSESGR